MLRTLRSKLSTLIAALLIAGLSTSTASAQSTYTWNLNANGNWDTSTNNWLLAGVPSAWSNGANTAVFGDAITTGRTLTLSSGITAGALNFTAGGTFAYSLVGGSLTLNNGAADAAITIGGGFVGTGTYSGTGGHNYTSATTTYANNLVITNNGAFGTTNFTLGGTIDRASAGGSITVGGQGNTTFSGAITANTTGGITKNGSGTLNLTGSNLFTGGITVNSGVVSTSGDGALGNAANGVALNGGTLRFTGTTIVGTARVVNVGASGGGIDLGSVTATFGGTGQFTGSGALLVSSTNGNTATLSITGANSGVGTYTGVITVGAPTAQLVGHTLATRVFSATAGTTLTLSGNGSLTGATGVVVSNAALLTITQPATAVTGRLGSAALTFHSGRFQYNTNTNGNLAITESPGNVTVTGQWLISGSSAAGSTGGTTLNFGTLTRTDNAVLVFRAPSGTGTGSIGGGLTTTGTRMLFSNLTPDTTSSGTTRSVVPWAGNITTTGGSFIQNFMTYDSNGFRPLNQTTEVATLSAANTLAAAAANVNIRVTSGGQTIKVGGQTINSYQQATSHTVTGTATQTLPGDILTITSGGWALNNGQTITNATINFPNGGYFLQGDNVTVGGFSRITGSGGLAVTSFSSSNYITSFTNTPDNGNTFTGGLFIQGNGRVHFTLNNQLGDNNSAVAAGNITLGGGQLLFNGTAATTLGVGADNRGIKVNESNGTIGITSSASNDLTIPGTISGSGQVQFGGGLSTNTARFVILTNASANTYTGGTLISTGNLRISNANQLSSGPILLNGGTLQSALGTTQTYATPLTMVNSSTLALQDATVTLNGGLNGSGTSTGGGATTMVLTRTGTTAGNTLVIAGAGNFAGQINNNGGVITLNSNGTLPSLGGLVMTAVTGVPSTLNIDNSSVNLSDRTGRATNLTLATAGLAAVNPTVNLTTNAAGSTFRFGSLTVSGGTLTNPNVTAFNVIDGGTADATIRFTSLAAIAANNTWDIIGSANLGEGTAGGSRIFFDVAPALTGGIIPNVRFTGSDQIGGTVTNVFATYDNVLGVIAFLQASGNIIDNIGSPTTTPAYSFLTIANTTARLGASIKGLTIDGHIVTLVDNVNAPQAGNNFTAGNTLVLSNGSLTVTTAPSSIVSANPTVVQFGAAGTTLANIAVAQNLVFGPNVSPTTTGGLVKTGAAAVTIDGVNNITGPYDLSGGALFLPTGGNSTAASLTGSGPLDLRSGTLNLNGNATTSYTGNLQGTAGSTITTTAGFTGTQTLGGLNTFTGSININGGTLVAGSVTALGNTLTQVTVTTGATLGFSGTVAIVNTNPVAISGNGAAGRAGAIDNISGTNSFAGPITFTGTTIGATAGTLTLTGGITGTNIDLTVNTLGTSIININTVGMNLGTGHLIKTGSGTLTLNTTNTYVNTTVSGGGVVAVPDFANLGSGSLTLDGGGISYTGGVSATFPTAIVTANGAVFGVTTSGVIGTLPSALNTVGSVTKVGAGTVQLAASTTNIIGALVVNAGTFDVNGNNLSVGSLSGAGGTLALGGTNITTTQTTATTLTSVVTGTGGSVTMNGAGGVLILAGTNTHTGGTFVTAGTVRLGATNGIPNGGNVTVSAAATFDVVGTVTANSSTPIGTITLNGGTLLATSGSSDYYFNKLLATGAAVNFAGTSNFWYHLTGASAAIETLASSTTTTITGPSTGSRIQNDTASALPIIVAAGTTPSGVDLNVNALISSAGTNSTYDKQGSGVMQISYTAANTTGNFNVTGGTLQTATGAPISGTVSVSTGAVLRGNGSHTGAITVAAGGTLAGGIGTSGRLAIGATTFAPGANMGVGINDGSLISNGTPGSSSLGGLPPGGPTSNTFLNKTTGTTLVGLETVNLIVDLGGTAFTIFQPYSYVIGQGFGNQSTLAANYTGTINFVNLGSGYSDLQNVSFSGDASEFIYINFTPAPEPGVMLCLAGLGVFAAIRRRRV